MEDKVDQMDAQKPEDAGEVQSDSSEANAPTESAGGKKRGKSSAVVWLLRVCIGIFIVFVEVVISDAVVTRFLLPAQVAEAEAPAEEAESGAKPQPEAENPRPSAADAGQSEEFPQVIGGIYSLSDIIVNPAFSQGRSYFVTSIVFAFDDKKKAELMKERELILKDRIISLLSKKTTMWLSNYSNREVLRQELLTIAHEVMGSNTGAHVYYTKYVIQ